MKMLYILFLHLLYGYLFIYKNIQLISKLCKFFNGYNPFEKYFAPSTFIFVSIINKLIYVKH